MIFRPFLDRQTADGTTETRFQKHANKPSLLLAIHLEDQARFLGALAQGISERTKHPTKEESIVILPKDNTLRAQ